MSLIQADPASKFIQGRTTDFGLHKIISTEQFFKALVMLSNHFCLEILFHPMIRTHQLVPKSYLLLIF